MRPRDRDPERDPAYGTKECKVAGIPRMISDEVDGLEEAEGRREAPGGGGESFADPSSPIRYGLSDEHLPTFEEFSQYE